MSRSCYIEKISSDIKEDIIGVGRTSAQVLKANQILLPVGGIDGNSKKLLTKKNTLAWAKGVFKRANEKYLSKVFGNVVEIDNDSNPKGTIVNITIKTSLVNAFERRDSGQPSMFQMNSNSTRKELVDIINNGLSEYIKNNGINVKFYDSLKEKYPNNPVAIFNVLKQLIEINRGSQDNFTLPEELGHHIVEALGDDHVLIKRAINLISRVGLQNVLGSEYELYNTLYKGDKTRLAHEALAKLISKSIVDEFKSPKSNDENVNKVFDTIKNIWNKFVGLFKPNDNIMNDLQSSVDELSNMILSGKKTVSKNSFTSNKPTDVYYQQTSSIIAGHTRGINNKPIPAEYRKTYKYYTDTITKLKNENSVLTKEYQKSSNPSDRIEIRAEFDANTERINHIKKALDELRTSGNNVLVTELIAEELEKLETYIDNLANNPSPNIDDVDYVRSTLYILKDYQPTIARATELLKRLRPYVKLMAVQLVNKYSTGKYNEKDIYENVHDINTMNKSFGTLSDIANHLGRTVGELIKNAQNNISTRNKRATDEIEEEINALKKHQESKGISSHKMYDVFIQEHKLKNGTTTTTLTKKYKKSFYDSLNETFNIANLSQAKAARAAIATFNVTTREWESNNPDDINPNYEIIKNTPELEKFYNFFKEKVAHVSDKLPVNLAEDFIPNVVEESLISIMKSDQGLMSKLHEGIQNFTDIYELDDNDNGWLYDQELNKDTLPVYYITPQDSKKKSKDLGRVLLKFMYFANAYEEMSEILPKTRLLQSEIAKTEFQSSTNNTSILSGEKTNVFEMAEKFIEMQVMGKMKNEDVLKTEYFNFQYGQIIDFGLKYTSLLRIGFNPFNAFTNVAIGSIGNIIEAAGGRFFGLGDLIKATGIYSKARTEKAFNKDSKLMKLIQLFNPLMELEDYENLEKIGISYLSSKKYQEKVKSMMYSMQREGENLMQVSVMIANLLHDKAVDKNGNKVSLWEAFKEDGTWDSDKMGYELSEDQIYKMSNKVQRINQSIHGRYSSKDAAILNQKAWFRMAFQFKKWIPAALEARFQNKKFDERLGVEVEGRYWTYVKGWNLMLAKITNNVEKMDKYKWTETDVYNTRKNITELVIAIASVTAYFGMKAEGDDDDKKKDGWYKFTMTQLDRISSDMIFLMNPLEANNQFSKGFIPLMKTVNDLKTVLYTLPYTFGYNEENLIITKGPRKGERRDMAAWLDATPMIKPAIDMVRLFNDTPYQDTTR